MKKLLFLLLLTFIVEISYCQQFSTNRTPIGLESNLLFRANERFSVTTSNFPEPYLSMLFDGNFSPLYVNNAISNDNPSVITIENLPSYHTQVGAWVGWTTRYCPPSRFKIEGFDTFYVQGGGWITIADYSNTNYSDPQFIIQTPPGVFTKLRFTVYPPCECSNIGISFGVSEFFFIHPEATTPYSGLFEVASNTWKKNGSTLYFESGNVGIGTNNPNAKLSVNGDIKAKEVNVTLEGWADFVFKPNYNLRPLSEVEQFIKTNNHLPEIPSEAEVKENGVSLGEMNAKLLQKVEELTLYLIEQEKKIDTLNKVNQYLLKKIGEMETNKK